MAGTTAMVTAGAMGAGAVARTAAAGGQPQCAHAAVRGSVLALLSKCVHYVVVKAVGWGRNGGSALVDVVPFARCSSVFLQKQALGMPMVDKVVC